MDHQFDESYPFVYIGHVCARGELLYKSHGDVCQKIIAPKDINMGVAQVFDP